VENGHVETKQLYLSLGAEPFVIMTLPGVR
jgi:hypothetical protein